MTSTQKVSCKNCRKSFTARTADIARGWGKFCSKHCAKVKRNAKRSEFDFDEQWRRDMDSATTSHGQWED
jgi:hypothetical protein